MTKKPEPIVEEILDVEADDIEVTADELLEAKILLLLEVYPVISPTMLQAGLGPQIPPAKWRPVLDKMLADGTVKQGSDYRQGVTGRYRTFLKVGLSKNITD